jgi:RNA polymerase sigma-70 factor (ECF subfamily)
MPQLFDPHKEHDLVAGLIAGNEQAFTQIVVASQAPLADYLRKYSKSQELVEDAIQDVLTAMWINRTQLDPSCKLSSYLFRAARNRLLDLLRGEQRQDFSHVVPSHAPNTAEDAVQLAEIQDAVHAILPLLPQRCRQVFLMGLLDGMTYREITAALGISRNTVRVYIVRAHAELWEGFAKRGLVPTKKRPSPH